MNSPNKILAGLVLHKGGRIRSSLSLQGEAEMVLVHIACLHGVNDSSSHSQGPPVKDP